MPSNDLTRNITRKLMRKFLKHFETTRVVTKTVNTQLFQGKFTPATGSKVDIKRPHDYRTTRSPTGDISGDKSDIISAKATAIVQDYFTASTEWDNVEEALELDQLDMILEPMARRVVTDLESDFAAFMMRNSGLSVNTPGVPLRVWSDVAAAGAQMASLGVPSDSPWWYLLNPFSQVALADVQTGLGAGDRLVQSAWEKAQISRDFGGMRALSSTQLATYTTDSEVDRAGTLDGAPTLDYATLASEQSATVGGMQQVLSVTAFGGGAADIDVKAGDQIEITMAAGEGSLNQATRTRAIAADGSIIPFRATVVSDVTLTLGAGDIVVTGPAIFETDGQYNTISATLAGTEVITLLGAVDTVVQPNLFYHQEAFAMATVKLPKLFSTDTTVVTEDGFSLRVSKYADGDTNVQKVRFDLLPAYGAMNPFFAGHGHGTVAP